MFFRLYCQLVGFDLSSDPRVCCQAVGFTGQCGLGGGLLVASSICCCLTLAHCDSPRKFPLLWGYVGRFAWSGREQHLYRDLI